MGVFRYPIEIAARPEGPYERFEAVVDTGSLYTWVPSNILRRLGLAPADKLSFVLADGRQIKRDAVEAVIRLEGHIRHTMCVFADDKDQILLGAVTLEQFALAADPVNKRLVPMPAIPAMGTRKKRTGLDVTGTLFRAARLSNDLGAIFSGKPSRMARRGKNKLLGRILARLGFWRLLWGK